MILQFHHGLKITPVAQPKVGCFDPEKVLWAIHRGAKCRVDFTHQWNYWPLMALPLQEARATCGLLPKLPATQAIGWHETSDGSAQASSLQMLAGEMPPVDRIRARTYHVSPG